VVLVARALLLEAVLAIIVARVLALVLVRAVRIPLVRPKVVVVAAVVVEVVVVVVVVVVVAAAVVVVVVVVVILLVVFALVQVSRVAFRPGAPGWVPHRVLRTIQALWLQEFQIFASNFSGTLRFWR